MWYNLIMAKVSGPMFSVGAHGTIGEAITFKGSPSGPRVTVKPVHKDRKSDGQLVQRTSYDAAVSYWWGLHVHEREFYNYLGDQIGMTGFNYCVGRYLEGWMS